MKKRFLYLIFPAVALILEILPFGAVCNFANPDGEPWRETFSYFSLTPFGICQCRTVYYGCHHMYCFCSADNLLFY